MREQEGSSGLGAWLQAACSWADGREHSHIWAGWEDDWMRARACSGRWSNGGTVALGNVGRLEIGQRMILIFFSRCLLSRAG
jgi:hypothetical protein